MICDCLQPDPQKRLSLDEMYLHDWFKVQSLRLAKHFLGLVWSSVIIILKSTFL